MAMCFPGTGLILLPVDLRNPPVDGDFILTTTQFGPKFSIGNGPHADDTYVAPPWKRGEWCLERGEEDSRSLCCVFHYNAPLAPPMKFLIHLPIDGIASCSNLITFTTVFHTGYRSLQPRRRPMS